MSEQTENQSEIEKKELELEKKVELHAMENQNNSDDSEDLEKVLRKKNELLNEAKKAKQEKRELEERLKKMEAQFQQQEQEKLEKNQEYKTLWERTQEELKAAREEKIRLETNIVKGTKRKAFDRELGKSLSKERYYDFVMFDDIIVEADGTVNQESVRYAVNMFRENYRELVPVQQVPRVGSEAPSNDGVIRPKKTLHDMNKNDRANLKRQRLLNK